VPSSSPNKLFPNQRGFPTPNTAPETDGERLFVLPSQEDWFALLMGALDPLRYPYNWFHNGDLSADEAASAFADIIDAAYENPIVSEDVPTPYWDEDTDVDDQAAGDVQTWYGTVEDPEVPPEELSFVENAAIWTFTGFLAVATIEVGAAPAILFSTIAPRFVLAVRRGNLAEIIRILVDGQDAATVDTTDYAEGDVIRTNIIADPEVSPHEILLVQVS